MRRETTMQLCLLSLRQPNGIGRFRSNAIPNVLDELNALGNRQFHVFGGGSLHIRSISREKTP